MPETKRCYRCGQEKGIDEYTPYSWSQSRSRCRQCRAEEYQLSRLKAKAGKLARHGKRPKDIALTVPEEFPPQKLEEVEAHKHFRRAPISEVLGVSGGRQQNSKEVHSALIRIIELQHEQIKLLLALLQKE